MILFQIKNTIFFFINLFFCWVLGYTGLCPINCSL